jgi:hypothetical protein
MATGTSSAPATRWKPTRKAIEHRKSAVPLKKYHIKKLDHLLALFRLSLVVSSINHEIGTQGE